MCVLLTSCVSITGFRGVVYDSSTGRPLEGVYVMAEYQEGGGTLFGHAGTWCVKTAGTYTGTDGKFSLPGSFRTVWLHPIKLGFALDRSKTFASGREDFFMTPQIPDKPRQSQYVSCGRAGNPADVIANIEYLEILGAEDRKYGRDSKIVDDTIYDLRHKVGSSEPEPASTR